MCIRDRNVTSLAGKLSLKEELKKMAELETMISMDSANMHLASLVGTRVISVWGATHYFAGFLGYGQSEKDIVEITDLACRPCSVFGNKSCYRRDYAVSYTHLDVYKRQLIFFATVDLATTNLMSLNLHNLYCTKQLRNTIIR